MYERNRHQLAAVPTSNESILEKLSNSIRRIEYNSRLTLEEGFLQKPNQFEFYPKVNFCFRMNSVFGWLATFEEGFSHRYFCC